MVKLPKDRAPATAGVAWLTLAFAILACVFSAIAMVRAGDARDAARDAAWSSAGAVFPADVAADDPGDDAG